jgi:hypothetical protein
MFVYFWLFWAILALLVYLFIIFSGALSASKCIADFRHAST